MVLDPALGDVVQEQRDIEQFPMPRLNGAREPIEFGLPNLRFGVTRNQTYGRVTLGLARVREVSNKKLVFDDRYIPPTLDIAAAVRLKGGLTDIVGRVEQRAEELAVRAVEATDGGSETFASFLLLQALNRWLPMLRHLESAVRRCIPERLFETSSEWPASWRP